MTPKYILKLLVLVSFCLMPLSVFGRSAIKSPPAMTKTKKLKIKVIKNMSALVREVKEAKTIKGLSNKGNRSAKLFRRKYFSKLGKIPLPPVVQSRNRVLIYSRGLKKRPDVLEGQVKGEKISYYYNSRDITRRKGESLDSWGLRLYRPILRPSKEKRKQKTSQLNLFFSEAWAETPDDFRMNLWFSDELQPFSVYQTSFFQALMSSMAVDQWENLDYKKDQRIDNLMYAGMALQREYDLQCSHDYQTAFFDMDHLSLSHKPFRVKASFNRETSRTNIAVSDKGPNNETSEFVRIAYGVDTDVNSIHWGEERGSGYLWDPKNKNKSYEQGIKGGDFIEGLESAFRNRPEGPDNTQNDSFYDHNNFKTEMQTFRVLSDVAVTCCQNKVCREQSGALIIPRSSGVDH